MTVWIPDSAKGRTTYHTKRCSVVERNTMRKVPKDAAERIGLRECKQCAGTTEDKDTQDWSHYHALTEAAQND